MKYSELFRTAIQLYLVGKYNEAYQYITSSAANVVGNAAHIYNLRFCLACKAGNKNLALEIMKEAIIQKGYWYSCEYLLQEDDIKELQDDNEFLTMVEICRIRELEAKQKTKPDLKVRKPSICSTQDKYPFMISLHGNGQNMLIAEEDWYDCGKEQYLFAFPQSSQIEFTGAYVWNELEKGCSEVKQHYDKLIQEYTIDTENGYIAGFSAGTRTALASLLFHDFKARGFILVGPWLPEIDEWKPALESLRMKGIKGYILCGENDDISLESAKKLISYLEELQIEHVFHLIEGLAHEYPVDFESYFMQAIEFFNKIN